MEFVRVDPPGCEMAVVRRESVGPRKGAVLFIHGLGDAASAFALALEAEALGGFEVVIPDLLGHGSSDKPLDFDYKPSSHAGTLGALLDGLGIEGPLHLVGYSMGAAIAVEIARGYVPPPASVVLVEPAVDPSRMKFARQASELTEESFESDYARFLAPYGLQSSSDTDQRWAETAAFASSRAIHRSSRALLAYAESGKGMRRLSGLSVPRALILSQATYGEWGAARELERTGVRVFLINSPDKMPMYDAPQPFYEAVARALERGSSATAAP